ncbi:putative glutathione [Lyophyllum shimeji]|uniref:glutathione transferase n=1 Tax=Lyophyllum shimeji TaxID=47721 RepID=A0A9P3PT31_LYOSH|nr:putative glutathione [Lyophyllum shimeji]
MVLKLYGHPLFTCSQRVAVVLLEKQVPFELVEVDVAKGEHKTPKFLERQPFGQTPYIDDAGFVLYESRAICRYIAAKYSGQGTTSLIPAGSIEENALFEQAASTEQNNFDPLAGGAISEKIIKPYMGLATDEAAFEAYLGKLDAKLDGYEAILSKQKYLAGDNLTLVDLFHLPYVHKLAEAGYKVLEVESRPNVVRWWKDISNRPAWLAVQSGIKSTA